MFITEKKVFQCKIKKIKDFEIQLKKRGGFKINPHQIIRNVFKAFKKKKSTAISERERERERVRTSMAFGGAEKKIGGRRMA